MQRTRQSLASTLVTQIAERIQSDVYRRGDQLPTEKGLAEEFGVSRTVVREAIATLKAIGLISTRQGIGSFVLEDGVRSFRIPAEKLAIAEELLKALEVRIAVEADMAALAATRRSPEDLAAIEHACRAMDVAIDGGEATLGLDIAFHQAIAQATGNRHFIGLFNYLSEVLMSRSQIVTLPPDANARHAHLRRISVDHHRIVDAITAGDSEGARAALRVHLGGSYERLAARI